MRESAPEDCLGLGLAAVLDVKAGQLEGRIGMRRDGRDHGDHSRR